MTEMPSLTSTAYATSTLDAGTLFDVKQQAVNNFLRAPVGAGVGAMAALQGALADSHQFNPKPKQPKESPVPASRIVKVFIADPNENLPLDKRILYSGDEKLTDLTDQELFFEVPIKELLDAHNAVRAATRDRKQTEKFGREVFLEPVRIRDLKMVVTTVAEF